MAFVFRLFANETRDELMEDKIPELDKAANYLNGLSDTFNEEIRIVNEHFKQLNIGIPCWVKCTDTLSLGYAKVGGSWGICIKENEEKWQFSDSPRQWRMALVEFLPDLIKGMTEEANKYSTVIVSKIEYLREFNYAMQEGLKSNDRTILVRNKKGEKRT